MMPEMSQADRLPDDVELVRVTPWFDARSVPSGLLAAHRVADGVWGRLVVDAGSVVFVFDERPGPPRTLRAGDTQVIPPGQPHHIRPDGGARFRVEFHR